MKAAALEQPAGEQPASVVAHIVDRLADTGRTADIADRDYIQDIADSIVGTAAAAVGTTGQL